MTIESITPAKNRASTMPFRTLHRRPASALILFAFAAVLVATVLSEPLPLAAQSSAATPQPKAAQPDLAAWKNYPYPADGFAAWFPSQPTYSKQSVPTAAGNFELHSYMAQDGPVALIVGVCDYGAATVKADPETILQNAKTGALNNTKSTLISEKKITLGTSPGIGFEAETEAIHISVRIYLGGPVLYQILVAYPIPGPYLPTSRFLDSFQLIPGPSPKPPDPTPPATPDTSVK